MSETPRTDAVKYHAKGQFQDVVAADFARQLERENARLQMELDATCNAEELRQVRAENARLRECNNACAEWVKQSANQWMHRPRGGWPIGLRKAYALVHDSALPNVKAQR